MKSDSHGSVQKLASKPAHQKRGGFTRTELLVVVLNFGLLVAILVPVVACMRTIHGGATTEALLNGLQMSISQYSANMGGALPGTFPLVGTPQTVGSGASPGSKISGTQNLVLALSYRLNVTPPDTAAGLTVPGLGACSVDVNNPNGPVDRSVTPNKQWSPFCSMVLNDLKTCAPGFTLSNAPGAWTGFPVIVDKFSDPLPILYFRRDQSSGLWAGNDMSSPASYYRQEDSEYLDATELRSVTGSVFDEYNTSSYSSKVGTGTAAANLGRVIQDVMAGSGTGTANRGDYVLISAGADRIFGKSGTATTSDDLVRVGTK